MAKALAPRLRIVIETPTPEHPAQTTEYELKTDNRDLVAFDMLRYRHDWPKFNEGLFLWFTVLAWSALKRSGVEVPPRVDDFIPLCIAAEPINEAGEAVQLDDESQFVDPTTVTSGGISS